MRECKAVAAHTALNGLEKVGKKVRANKENDGKIDGIYTHAKKPYMRRFSLAFQTVHLLAFSRHRNENPPENQQQQQQQ